jgi:hypothetical protein
MIDGPTNRLFSIGFNVGPRLVGGKSDEDIAHDFFGFFTSRIVAGNNRDIRFCRSFAKQWSFQFVSITTRTKNAKKTPACQMSQMQDTSPQGIVGVRVIDVGLKALSAINPL